MYTLLILLTFTGLLYVLVQTSLVQNWLVHQAASKLSKDLNTKVKIDHVDFTFFNKMALEGTLVQDHNKDTLLYAGKLNVRITDWFFLKDKIELQYVGLEDASVYMHRVTKEWNYQFLLDYFATPPSAKKKKSIALDLKLVELNNVHFLRKDEWRGENLMFHVRKLDVDAREFDLDKKKVVIGRIFINEPLFTIYNYPGNRPPRPKAADGEPLISGDTAITWNPDGWAMTVEQLVIKDGIFKSDSKQERQPHYYFDGKHMLFANINTTFKNLALRADTISADAQLSARERSGFHIQSLTSAIKWHPKGMEFNDLDIITNKSRLRNSFVMRYDSFSDMSDFIEKVSLEGDFKDSQIESDDIAFFAPALEQWRKRISITGIVKGTISNLSARNMIVEAGKNTILNGDIKLKGLPDIEQTFIDFKATDFRTNYADAVAIIPELRQLRTPRLDRIKYMRFRGNFTGFINDFVTFGTIETNLGNIKTDVNMKLPENGTATYSGSVSTVAFNIGQFMSNEQLGRITFNGKIKGSNFRLTNMSAELDGNVKSIEYNGYNYNNIVVKGTLARKMFNGSFIANDPELKAQLNGLIDFKKELPRFNFTANIENANLKKLNLYREDINVKGQVDFNFTGSNIDNFLGTARIHHSTILKNGKQISFDSLNVASTQTDSSKIIDIVSNEFDVHIEGEYSIYELPNTFQTFLNRYYPSYINPPLRQLKNENFDFTINTRKVDDYLDLVDKNLNGFNDSHISGSINSRKTELDVKAFVPQFSYKNISFNEVSLDGKGNLDTLLLETKVKDVIVNDSLHFPGTTVNIQSSQDISAININTSANKTLNAANISGQVQTLRDGVRILFNPSRFNINGKEWTIDKDGELIISKELITSSGLRIYNENQEVYVSTHPSSIANTNDIQVTLKKINIGDFTPFFIKKNRLEGLLSGTIDISDPLGKMIVEARVEADQFRFDNDSIGKIQLNPSYSALSGKINFNVVSDNKDYNFNVAGSYTTRDSTGQQLELVNHFENTNINLLEKYLGNIFTRIAGKATGDLRISGPVNNLKYIGDIKLKDAGLMVNYTRCYYKIPEANIRFADGYIDFGTFGIRDTLNNKADVTNGRLYHEGFNNLAFDFNFRTNQLLLLNTGPTDNKLFYGNIIAKATVSFTGPLQNMQMNIKGEPTDTSNIFLPIGSSRESGDADFIVWKVYGTEMQPQYARKNVSNLNVSLDLNANKFANVSVILDELTGDIIRAKGSGNLQINVGTNENMTMEGRFDVDEGEYNFSFQSIKKLFRLRPGVGNYISWNGDPNNATINITAEYEALNVRFKDLGITDSKEGSLFITNKEVLNYRGKVVVVATLKDKLTAPVIKFQLELPPDSPLKNDQEALTLFQQIQRDENELNKQVSFLVAFNRFGPLTSNRGASANIANAAFEGIVVNSISGAISKVLTSEFSKILRNIFKDEGLRININASFYNGTNLVDNFSNAQLTLPDRTNVNFSIAKSYLDDRLTFVVGSALDVGLNTAQQSQSSFQFLPDVTAEWKLSADGKFRLSFFYRDSYSYISGRSRNRSGTSISYRKEFDRIEELFRKAKKQ